MQIGLNIHTLSQPTKITPSNLEHNTISSTKLEDKKSNDPIKFDIRSSEKDLKQPEHKFNELDLWKMLKDKGVPLWMILEMLQKFRKEKESQNNSIQNPNVIEETNENRLNEVM
ncbi:MULTISPECIES: DUF3914 domain-containing protein [Bacillus]|uniref:DUF3914 domain-containing protein n=1 Tax=Bacillus thuringiensis serovar sooncheon TaxID=180891 RepID=A0A9Q5SKM3_BACTU|nr:MULTISPECIES: DUF3914 domain-containing protein [Bacillus]MDC7975292.1 DUF3914 domain-containing protein [Bacillus sp. BLCC-B18]OTW72617.1 hypothetical protein BK707_05900 [Bacillus thuringiensis serovar coreanensis]OTX49673.1 hypothetical protein BK724_09570 [Bacillus thuringiensis serovar sooncheon]OTX57150.1 hypothetical protein BK725_04910 [Bacillus thuringiensis serovar guiyangiensis]OTX72006.1 hypothetical protein BK727_06945 [Bacillus thuringiensis serovar roskildiensis]